MILSKGIVTDPISTVVPEVVPVYGVNWTVAVLPLKLLLMILAPINIICYIFLDWCYVNDSDVMLIIFHSIPLWK